MHDEIQEGPDGKRQEFPLEQAELLPERLTLAALEIGRKEFDPTFFPVNSPWSNMAHIDAHGEPQILGGILPILISLVPSINFIFEINNS
ncbi:MULTISPECIES: hypothetical protein [Frankia]|uniref:Uncharacterized protein n=1 Tax=Frankia alni (strain DSM 45986 / CECT 9034 / ACN14a) TaxID=326424 RepID=Q0RGL7_FRAAA|nr:MULTISPECIES: hypothetical protein [Frankia]CAJ63370.1 hypothetical protein FRAAL4729 [Frankia alni ACN14a]